MSRSVEFATGLQSDHTVGVVTAKARRDYPAPLRRVRYVDGTSENAVKTQIWIALSIYPAGRHLEKASRARREPLQTSANSERHTFRENANFHCRF